MGKTLLQKFHPYIPNLLVRSDGAVYVKDPGRYNQSRHWTFGSFNHIGGYKRVTVQGKTYLVHRLVVETFIGIIPPGMEVDHINRDKSLNAVWNLRIVSRKENRHNRADVDKCSQSIGCSPQFRNKATYSKYYRHTETGNFAVKKANEKYWQSHKSVRFNDGKTHAVPNILANKLLALPVSNRVWEI